MKKMKDSKKNLILSSLRNTKSNLYKEWSFNIFSEKETSNVPKFGKSICRTLTKINFLINAIKSKIEFKKVFSYKLLVGVKHNKFSKQNNVYLNMNLLKQKSFL